MKDTLQSPITEKRDWRDDFLDELGKNDVIAVESSGILTKKDIDTAMCAINESEQQENEEDEWKLIREAQLERANRLFGGDPV